MCRKFDLKCVIKKIGKKLFAVWMSLPGKNKRKIVTSDFLRVIFEMSFQRLKIEWKADLNF